MGYRRRRDGKESRKGPRGQGRLEQFEVQYAEALTPEALDLNRPYRKLVSVGTPDDLKALEVALVETDPTNTEVVVVTAHTPPEAGAYGDPEHTEVLVAAARTPEAPDPPLGYRDCRLMTTVVNRSELAGKAVKAVVVLTEDPENALLRAVQAIEAEEFLIGPSAAEPPDCPIYHLVARWTAEANGQPVRLTIRRVARDRDERRDLQGGSRIPRALDDGETAPALEGSGTD